MMLITKRADKTLIPVNGATHLSCSCETDAVLLDVLERQRSMLRRFVPRWNVCAALDR